MLNKLKLIKVTKADTIKKKKKKLQLIRKCKR